MFRSLVLCVLAAVGLAACGGNPSAASGTVQLRGTVVGDVAAASGARLSAEQAALPAARLTVAVQENTRLTTTVGADGAFAIDGVPEGRFTLVFTRDGVPLGTIDISGASAGQEIRITVRVTPSSVALVAIQNADGNGDDDDGDNGAGDANRTCAISGGKVGQGIELEGHVASGDAAGFEIRVNGNRVKGSATVRVTTGGASFKCNGKPTAADCRDTVKPSAQVHVKGHLDACDVANALVAASEVKVQKP